jgi:CheY-specific phosphatase CheX
MQASDLTNIVPECCAEVLESMYFTTVLEASSQCAQPPAPQAGQLAFGLRFRGDIHGSFGLSIDGPMALALAANFLGEEEEALTEVEVAEVVGELTNMFCGSIVSRIEGSTKFALSHPEPLIPEATGLDILTSTLETDGGTLHTWIAIDPAMASVDTVINDLLQAAH